MTAALNRLAYPPPNPFQVTVAVTVTDSAGETGEGTVTCTTRR